MGELFIVGLCALAPLADFKLLEIKYIEYFLLITLFPISFLHVQGVRLGRIDDQISRSIMLFLVFIFSALLLALFSLAYPVFPITESLLKNAPFLSLSRIIQVILSYSCFVCLYRIFLNSTKNIKLFVDSYIIFGLLNSLYAILSYILLYIGIDLGGAYDVSGPRAKGGFFEGGPLGSYLVSVIIIILIKKYYLKWNAKFIPVLQLAIVTFALILSQSKAGVLISLLLITCYFLNALSMLRIGAIVLFSGAVFYAFEFLDNIYAYIYSIINFDEMIDSRMNDPAFYMGRIMAISLVPRIIWEYPITGIGIGNYSLQRNNPQILQGLPTTEYWDLPGLGFVGDVAELGIPLSILLLLLITIPLRVAIKQKSTQWVVMLSSFQVLYYFLGGQLTFVYPWMLSALALAFTKLNIKSNTV